MAGAAAPGLTLSELRAYLPPGAPPEPDWLDPDLLDGLVERLAAARDASLARVFAAAEAHYSAPEPPAGTPEAALFESAEDAWAEAWATLEPALVAGRDGSGSGGGAFDDDDVAPSGGLGLSSPGRGGLGGGAGAAAARLRALGARHGALRARAGAVAAALRTAEAVAAAEAEAGRLDGLMADGRLCDAAACVGAQRAHLATLDAAASAPLKPKSADRHASGPPLPPGLELPPGAVAAAAARAEAAAGELGRTLDAILADVLQTTPGDAAPAGAKAAAAPALPCGRFELRISRRPQAEITSLTSDASDASDAGASAGSKPGSASGAAAGADPAGRGEAGPSRRAVACGVGELWEASGALGRQGEDLSSLGARLGANVLGPLLIAAAGGGVYRVAEKSGRRKGGSEADIVDVWRADAAGGGGGAAAAGGSGRGEAGPADGPAESAILAGLAAVGSALSCVCSRALDGRAHLAARLGTTLWPALSDVVRAAVIPRVAPQEPIHLPAWGAVEAALLALEEQAAGLGLLSARGADAVGRPVAAAVAAAAAAYAHGRATTRLAAVRSLARDGEATSETLRVGPTGLTPDEERAAGEAPVPPEANGAEAEPGAVPTWQDRAMGFEPCLVSRAAVGAAAEIEACLREAVGVGAAAADASSRGARDAPAAAAASVTVDGCEGGGGEAGEAGRLAASLAAAAAGAGAVWRAVAAAVRSGRELATDPALAMLHRNDLAFLSHRLLCLSIAYAPALRPALGAAGAAAAAAALRAEAGRLHAAAAAAAGAELERRVSAIQATLAEAEGFEALEVPGRKEAVEGAVTRATAAAGRAAAAWAGPLPAAAGGAAADALASALCRAVAAEVLAMRDISVDECDILGALLPGVLASELVRAACGREAAAADAAAAAAGAGAAEGGGGPAESDSSPRGAWAMVAEITELLSARLADIAPRWASGRLRRAGLSAAHVRGLVAAVFERSPRRDECMAQIRDDDE